MATKTISLELDAYERLRRARRSPRESFSSVVRRARWEGAGATGPEVLAMVEPDRVDRLQRGERACGADRKSGGTQDADEVHNVFREPPFPQCRQGTGESRRVEATAQRHRRMPSA